MTELQMQAQCTQWFWNTFPQHRGRLRRIKNELDNHPRKSKQDIMKQLAENKATGVVSGDSDLYWIDFKNTYLELKVEEGRQSDSQEAFQTLVESFGHAYVLVWSIEEFKKIMLILCNGKAIN